MITLRRRRLIQASSLLGLVGSMRSGFAPGATPLARLSLNENPYGPAPGARRALAVASSEVDRYGDGSAADRLVAQIAALEGIDGRQIVMGEMLEVLGLFLAAQTPTGGRFVYSVPGYTAMVDAARPGAGARRGPEGAADGRAARRAGCADPRDHADAAA